MSRLNQTLGAALSCAVAASVLATAFSAHAAPAPSTVPRGAAPTPARAAAGPVTKLLVVVEENHSFAQMRAQMPYTYSLAKSYGYATGYRALSHPSLPNYLAVSGGSMFGVGDDRSPLVHRLPGRSVFGQAVARGRSARVYAEGMPSRCSTTNAGRYVARHNPWVYFPRDRAGCRRHERRFGAFGADVAAGRLPRVGMVVPDLCHDAHDCPLSVADAWFQKLMTRVVAGPDWKAGRLAVVLTADEDDRRSGNVVLTVVAHPSQRSHVVTSPLTHYSLTRLYGEVAGLPLLRNAASAPSMARAFGLPVR